MPSILTNLIDVSVDVCNHEPLRICFALARRAACIASSSDFKNLIIGDILFLFAFDCIQQSTVPHHLSVVGCCEQYIVLG